MNTNLFSTNLMRVLIIAILVLPLALGAASSAKATTVYTVTAWGTNTSGQTDVPADLTDVVAIAAGMYHSLALKSDGTVIAWGDNTSGEIDVPSDLTGVVAIAADGMFSLALKNDGTIVGWGDNTWGQLNIPSGLTDVVAITSGWGHSMALKADGTISVWGYGSDAGLAVPEGLNNVIAIAAGGTRSMALKGDGTVVGWGYDGGTYVPAGLTDVVAIDAGLFHGIALKSDGTVVSWDGGGYFNPADYPEGLTDVVAIAAGGYHNTALKSDGTVLVWGGSLSDPGNDTSGLSGVTAIAAGGFHNLAIVPVVPTEPVNTAPTANPGGPYLGAVNTAITFDASSSSDPESDALTYAWTFCDGSTGTDATPAYTYTNSGLYSVCLTVNDGSLDSEPACTLAVIYDPSEGFVTGGGWIDSPAGAYKADQTLSGQATFGFISKYQKGASVPSGNTAFEFDLAGLAFASQSYEWLVVNQGGSNAQFKGSGLINGEADLNGNAYKFMIWATDGSGGNGADTLRIRIWWEDATGEHDVYDNGADLAIGAGNIVVHTNK